MIAVSFRDNKMYCAPDGRREVIHLADLVKNVWIIRPGLTAAQRQYVRRIARRYTNAIPFASRFPRSEFRR